jgi:pyrroline-5-carboxylate reductase
MTQQRLAFIGAGNMARSLVGGLIADGWDPAVIGVSDPDIHQLGALTSHFRVSTDTDNRAILAGRDVVVLAVKPQILREVASSIADQIQQSCPLVISIAAGVRSSDLERWLGGNCAVVRCMPNTPALVQTGATALFATRKVSNEQKDLAESILRAAGLTVWVDDEELLDAVTALSGSGPAYFFLVMEALEEAGITLGLGRQTSRLLTLQTALGAAKMALESNDDTAALRQRVTSPGGTTERALEVFEDGKLRALFVEALTAARDRSRELADQLGGE